MEFTSGKHAIRASLTAHPSLTHRGRVNDSETAGKQASLEVVRDGGEEVNFRGNTLLSCEGLELCEVLNVLPHSDVTAT